MQKISHRPAIDLRPILHINGILLLMLAATMLIPAVVDLLAGDEDWLVFAQSAFITAFVGGILMLTNQGTLEKMTIRQAFIFTTSSWLFATLFAALPFYLCALELGYADAFFEAASGLTTTGSTILVGLDALPKGLLLWRALMHVLGGVGVVVLALAILPMLQIGGMQLFRTESSDKSEKIMPRTGQIAMTTFIIFMALSTLCAFLFWLAGMSSFDAITHAFATVSTGGFSTHDASFGYFKNAWIEWICIIFMLASAAPLILYYQMVRGKPLALWHNSQVRWMLGIVIIVSVALSLWQLSTVGGKVIETFRYTLFNVSSVITTTGFVVSDYMQWGNFAIVVFFIITAIGGCTGSTSGGIKLFRFQILYEIAKVQFNQLIHPHGVFLPRYDGKPISPDVATSVMSFIILFGTVFALFTVALSACDLDFITSLSAVAQALANVGPGLGSIIGPAGNFAPLPDTAKWILSFAMIMGRLELFTFLILLTPSFWRQ